MVFVRYRPSDETSDFVRQRRVLSRMFTLGDIEPHENALEWQCPWCSFSLLFNARDDEVAESAVRSHLLSRHGGRMWGDVIDALKTLQSGWR